MPNDLDRKLLETDLDRLIELARPEVQRIECDATCDDSEDCVARVRLVKSKPASSINRKYILIKTEDLEQLHQELLTFQRRFKEMYGS